MITYFPELAQSFTEEIKERVNTYIMQLFNEPPDPTLSIEEFISLLKSFKGSQDKENRDVFAYILRQLFEEYTFFPWYTDRPLQIAAQLYGEIIDNRIVTHGHLGIALQCILESLCHKPNTNMFRFGVTALESCKTKIQEYPQFCLHMLQIPHFLRLPCHLIEYCCLDNGGNFVQSGLRPADSPLAQNQPYAMPNQALAPSGSSSKTVLSNAQQQKQHLKQLEQLQLKQQLLKQQQQVQQQPKLTQQQEQEIQLKLQHNQKQLQKLIEMIQQQGEVKLKQQQGEVKLKQQEEEQGQLKQQQEEQEQLKQQQEEQEQLKQQQEEQEQLKQQQEEQEQLKQQQEEQEQLKQQQEEQEQLKQQQEEQVRLRQQEEQVRLRKQEQQMRLRQQQEVPLMHLTQRQQLLHQQLMRQLEQRQKQLLEQQKQQQQEKLKQNLINAGVTEFYDLDKTFSPEVEKKASYFFQAIFGQPPTPATSVSEALHILKCLKLCPDQMSKDVSGCIVLTLMKEFMLLPQCSTQQLHLMAQLYGGVIECDLLSDWELGYILRYILESLRLKPNCRMFHFGVVALEIFKNKLKDFSQFCQLVCQIPHICYLPPLLYEYVQYGIRRLSPPVSMPPVSMLSLG